MRVVTSSGILTGTEENSIWCFRGIPYARAERFCAPVEYRSNEERNCSCFGKMALQPGMAAREEYSE